MQFFPHFLCYENIKRNFSITRKWSFSKDCIHFIELADNFWDKEISHKDEPNELFK